MSIVGVGILLDYGDTNQRFCAPNSFHKQQGIHLVLLKVSSIYALTPVGLPCTHEHPPVWHFYSFEKCSASLKQYPWVLVISQLIVGHDLCVSGWLTAHRSQQYGMKSNACHSTSILLKAQHMSDTAEQN